jgi:alanine dehydrogenase
MVERLLRPAPHPYPSHAKIALEVRACLRPLGADKGGDQELDPKIVQRARIFVDDIRQCRTDGEINVPLRQGLIQEKDIAGEIGEVVTGRKPGRVSDGEITLFDSTGIALQDSATVPLLEKKMIST